MIYKAFFSPTATKTTKQALIIAFWLIAPIGFSYYLYYNYQEQGEKTEIVVVQPNIDPYTEKFVGTDNFIPYEQQTQRFIQLSEQKVTPNTKYLIWPETALDNAFQETQLSTYPEIQTIMEFRRKYPNLKLITGVTSIQFYENKALATPTARYSERVGYYDYFNTALHIDESDKIDIYHKSKLVPGVEIMPYPDFFSFLKTLIIDLGGTTGGLGRQTERTVFTGGDSITAAAIICYESIYGDFVSQYVKNGANLLFIITNDGWWGNTPGHKQHLYYGRLRCIENRKSIARSANTGISAFINQRGEIISPTAYWVQDVISGEILRNDIKTFYTEYGDYIGRVASFLSPFMFFTALVRKRIRPKKVKIPVK